LARKDWFAERYRIEYSDPSNLLPHEENVRAREERIMDVISAHANGGIGHVQLAVILGIDRKNLTPFMKRLISKGLVRRGPGKQGKYYPTSEYRGPIMTADILGKAAAVMILDKEDFQINSPYFRDTKGDDSLDLTLFDFSNKVGAIITYLLIQSMNSENKITGNATNDEEKDLNVERWIDDAISSLGFVLLPLFKDRITVPLTCLHFSSNSAISSIDYQKLGLEFVANAFRLPRYTLKQEFISDLMAAFSNSYPNIKRELKISNSKLQQLAARELDHFEHVKRRFTCQNKCKHDYEPPQNKVIVDKSKSYNRRYLQNHAALTAEFPSAPPKPHYMHRNSLSFCICCRIWHLGYYLHCS
jgi:predicted transcriptional regulator